MNFCTSVREVVLDCRRTESGQLNWLNFSIHVTGQSSNKQRKKEYCARQRTNSNQKKIASKRHFSHRVERYTHRSLAPSFDLYIIYIHYLLTFGLHPWGPQKLKRTEIRIIDSEKLEQSCSVPVQLTAHMNQRNQKRYAFVRMTLRQHNHQELRGGANEIEWERVREEGGREDMGLSSATAVHRCCSQNWSEQWFLLP